MALVLKHDLLYLHIPKTGGNWLTSILESNNLVLGSIGHKHAAFDALLRARNPLSRLAVSEFILRRRSLSRSPRMFCVVRRPLRWYESWYKYRRGRDNHRFGEAGHLEKPHVNSDINHIEPEGFEDFVNAVNRDVPGYVSQLYAHYAFNSQCRILHKESLARDLVDYLEKLDVPIDRKAALAADRIGVSPPSLVEWSPEMLRRTIDNERAAFVRYGYEPHG